MKHVVVVGATDGIGRALAGEYLGRGWRVGLVGRDEVKLGRVRSALREAEPGGRMVTVTCDVTREDDCATGFQEVVRGLGQMDLLVYCAGVMRPEDTPEARAAAAAVEMAVNVVGAIRWLEPAADYLLSLGRGRLAAIGSVAGERGRKGHPVYGASKAALHAYMEGLRHRLHGTGIGVSVVKPGWVATRMLPDALHESRMAVSPGDAARAIADGLARGRESFFVPRRWAIVAGGLRAMPRFLHKRIAPP